MIYVLGDSFSWGMNFWYEKNKERQKLLYSHHLAKKLNASIKNLSVPGGSNWRISRLIMNLPLTENDIVIIGWTNSVRFEVPFNNLFVTKNESVVMPDILENFENSGDIVDENFMGTFIENNGDYLTRRINLDMFRNHKKIENQILRNLVETYYKHFYNENWHDDMFNIMFAATLLKLKNSKCKFRMFNAFISPIKKDNNLYDIPEYMFGYKNTMLDILRPNNKKDIGYYSAIEHEKVAQLIYENLN